MLNMFDTEDVLFSAQSKNKREEASYSTRIRFGASEIKEMVLKARLFVDKAENIIKEEVVYKV